MSEFEPEIVALYCKRSLRSGDEFSVAAEGALGFSVREAMMPCSAKVEVSYILRLLESGADGVQVVACPDGDCHSLVGSVKVQKRVDYVRSLIEQIGIGMERVGVSRAEKLSAADLLRLVGGRAKEVKSLGPNPMKEGK